MLETKNLCKTYKPKKGVPVLAVDHVSLRFPEKGMVFLLGKSGSGKSTMLNLLGGLDQYDDGEIIIKGVSSKDFSQQYFDSYRNTYVGFIFQEYNVLEEFTVGANIALALELQGKTATDEELNRILKIVDLEGFGDRKPNELSGGQKQRVAIARALVKNPEIIMADEPTGALDSNTGRQVLDTLKNLSADKLVIIVSHDREYAEQYADRIIELADGKVIRDVEAKNDGADAAEKSLVYRASSIEIPADYHLTEEDRQQINAYLDQLRTGASIMLPSKAQKFCDTDTEAIPVQDGSGFNLIKSKLPLKSAFKIGCSSLKHKKFRLVMTILLSVTAFTLFSLVDTFSSYDHICACTDSLLDSDVSYVSANKSVKRGSGLDEWWSTYGQHISEEEMEQLRQDTGLPVTGLFLHRGADYSFSEQYDMNYEFSKGSYSTAIDHFCGFAEITQESLDQMHYKLIAGKLPDGKKDEIAVSAALCDTFVKAGYRAPKAKDAKSVPKLQKVGSPLAMVGKVIRLMDTDYTITGVIDTDFDLSRYDRLTESKEQDSVSGELVDYILYSEYNIAVNYSLTGAAMVGTGKLAEMIADQPKIYEPTEEAGFNVFLDSKNGWGGCYSRYYTTLDMIPASEIIWLGDEKKELADDEVIINLKNLEYSNSGEEPYMSDTSKLASGKTEATAENIKDLLDKMNGEWKISFYYWENGDYNNYQSEGHPAKIVGCIKPDSDYNDALVIPEKYLTKMVSDLDGIYDSAVGPMPESREEVEQLVRFCYSEDKDAVMRFEMNHPVIYELDTVNSTLKLLAKVFFWIGLFFAAFAALLLANFISTSIHYKRQEIGILRAIGSRSADVFRIFFSESFVIALINFLISALLCAAAVIIINTVARSELGVLITILHFGVRQIILLAVLSILIAAAASLIPVYRIASKRPIDAIRDK